jgi:hypothetical protein
VKFTFANQAANPCQGVRCDFGEKLLTGISSWPPSASVEHDLTSEHSFGNALRSSKA